MILRASLLLFLDNGIYGVTNFSSFVFETSGTLPITRTTAIRWYTYIYKHAPPFHFVLSSKILFIASFKNIF